MSDWSKVEKRLKETFDIDIEKGAFAEWKKGLSEAARSHLSAHDMAVLDRAFMETQLRMAGLVEETIAKRLYSTKDMELMYRMGERTFPWAKPPKGGR